MRAREIKDLSIAIEALSRVPGYECEAISSRIKSLIDDLLKEAETKPTPQPAPLTKPTDNIPF